MFGLSNLLETDIQFFNSRDECIQNYEKLPWIQKVITFFESLGNQLICKVGLLFQPSIEPLTNPDSIDFSKKRLIVCIHGVYGSPSELKNLVHELQAKDPSQQSTIFVPRVLARGADPLDQMAEEIFASIQKWALEGDPGKELVLVGVSNGARISRAIETRLTKENRVNIEQLRVVSVVGARRGSSLVTLANYLGLSWAISKPLSEEMPKNSERNKKLDLEWDQWIRQSEGLKCDFTFLASPYDAHVPDRDSSLPPILEGHIPVRYGFVMKHGHFTAIDGAAKTIANLIFDR